MEERLIRQQQEMEEDQRWLEKEERFLVTESQPCSGLLLILRRVQSPSFPKQESFFYVCSLKLSQQRAFAFLELLFQDALLGC